MVSLLADTDSCSLFLFVAANCGFMFVEFGFGFASNSLGLISDGFHMGFNSFGLVISLLAMQFSRKSPTLNYSYGYDRHEVLAAFSNAIFLTFVLISFELKYAFTQF